jgi:uncharacterized membrane protein
MDVAGYYQLQGQNLDKPMIPKEVQELTLEQSLELRIIADKLSQSSADELRLHIMALTKMLMIKSNILRYFMGKELKVNLKSFKK